MSRSKKEPVTIRLKSKERGMLKRFVNKGSAKAREIKRANILLLSDKKKAPKEMHEFLGVSKRTIQMVKERYLDGGLKKALHDRPRSGSPVKFSGRTRAKLTALACTKSPKGYDRWSLRLLSNRAVELGLGGGDFSESIEFNFKKDDIKPHLKRQWCLSRMDSNFIWNREQVLSVYERRYSSRHPVICFDERPCQLIEDVLIPVPMKPGRRRREDYEYKRKGTCCILMAIEPKTGKRIVEVSQRRIKVDYARFMCRLANEYFQADKKITLVQDNLNTHNPTSFYENLLAEEAFALTERFEMVYTPKHASWLNMAEIEFSALSKQCLDRRIGDIETMGEEVGVWVKERNTDRVKINW